MTECNTQPKRRGESWIALLLWAATFAVLIKSPVFYLSDSRYSMLTAESLLRNHTADLSSFKIPEFEADLPFNTISGNHAYQLERVGGHLLYGFPHGTPILSIPFVAAMDAIGLSAARRDGAYDMAAEYRLQKLLAALLMATFAVLAFRAARLFFGTGWSLFIALAAVFGTQVWSIASRSMWSHTWEITIAMLVVELLLGHAQGERPLRPAWLATLLAWIFFVRPTGAVPVMAVSGFVFVYRRSAFPVFAATGAAWFAAFTVYNHWTFGTLLPFYYERQTWSLDSLPIGLYGVLLSPSRGLFIFCPIVAVVLYMVVGHWRTLPHRSLAATALFVFGGVILISAARTEWWGGRCYGPRYLTDVLPWLILLAILGWAGARIGGSGIGRPVKISAVTALLLGVIIHGKGALSWVAAGDWSDSRPQPADLLDWSHPQFLATASSVHRRISDAPRQETRDHLRPTHVPQAEQESRASQERCLLRPQGKSVIH